MDLLRKCLSVFISTVLFANGSSAQERNANPSDLSGLVG
jgi:hypothetical protein